MVDLSPEPLISGKARRILALLFIEESAVPKGISGVGRTLNIGLSGSDIPPECRILSIVDAFDAMTGKRPYNRVKTAEEAITEIRECSGFQFDPEMVEIFIQVVENNRNPGKS